MGRTARAEGSETSGKDEKENQQIGGIVEEETRLRIKAKLDRVPVGQKLPVLKAAIAMARKIRQKERGDPPTGKVIYVNFNKNRP